MYMYYPIHLNIRDRKCIVIGGGEVALRKAKTLLEHKASVEVISPYLCAELKDLVHKGQIKVHHRRYRPSDLKGARIAIVATGNKTVNKQVYEEAQKRAVLINIADEPQESDFIAPSTIHLGDITISISTGGRSPALARKISTILERELCGEYNALLDLIIEVRREVKSERLKISGDIWRDALDLDVLVKLLKSGERKKVKSFLLGELRKKK